MKTIFLSSKDYPDSEANYGDCILIDSGSDLVIYDCGSEEHADRVLDYMSKHNYKEAKLVLSHNDSDHFAGVQKLIDANAITDVYTLLLLKYKEELLDKINDGRISNDSLTKRITEIFENIYSLSGQVHLHDMFSDTIINDSVSIVGPDLNYALDAIAKRIDSRQGDTIDNETIVNAISCQVSVKISANKLLLCGDSNYEAIKDKLSEFYNIQLPHHGKYEHAKKILETKGYFKTIYYVSDNTGSSNGGSDELMQNSRGYAIYNTINGDQICSDTNAVIFPKSTLSR